MTETAQSAQTPHPPHLEDRLISWIQPVVEPLGFEVVHVEVQNFRHKILRLFIDRISGGGVTLDDCAEVSKALDEPLEKTPELEAIFKGPYDLEVSSPGVDRPLRKARDFVRFEGREARIHVFRPLTAEELGDAAYQARNPKQKNFLGVLRGLRNPSTASESVLLEVSADGGSVQGKTAGRTNKKKAGKKNSAEADANRTGTVVAIPLPLISKANLEPAFDFDGDEPAVDLANKLGDEASAN